MPAAMATSRIGSIDAAWAISSPDFMADVLLLRWSPDDSAAASWSGTRSDTGEMAVSEPLRKNVTPVRVVALHNGARRERARHGGADGDPGTWAWSGSGAGRGDDADARR